MIRVSGLLTEEQFLAYYEVQMSGEYNMFDQRAITESGLTKEEYLEAMGNYDLYKRMYVRPNSF